MPQSFDDIYDELVGVGTKKKSSSFDSILDELMAPPVEQRQPSNIDLMRDDMLSGDSVIPPSTVYGRPVNKVDELVAGLGRPAQEEPAIDPVMQKREEIALSRPELFDEYDKRLKDGLSPEAAQRVAEYKAQQDMFGGGKSRGVGASADYSPTPLHERIAKSFATGGTGMVKGIGGALKAIGAKDSGQTLVDTMNKVEENYLKVYDPNFIDELSAGFGSAASFFIPGIGVAKGTQLIGVAAPRLAAIFGTTASAFLESAVEAGSVYEEMEAKGKPESERQKAAGKTFVLNLPINYILDQWVFKDLPEGKRIKKLFHGGGQEAFQEYYQQLISSVTQGEEPTWTELGKSAGIGFLVGGGIAALKGNKKTVAPVPPVEPTSEPDLSYQEAAEKAGRVFSEGGQDVTERKAAIETQSEQFEKEQVQKAKDEYKHLEDVTEKEQALKETEKREKAKAEHLKAIAPEKHETRLLSAAETVTLLPDVSETTRQKSANFINEFIESEQQKPALDALDEFIEQEIVKEDREAAKDFINDYLEAMPETTVEPEPVKESEKPKRKTLSKPKKEQPKNPYLTMPIERVKQDAEQGVKLAKEALTQRAKEVPEKPVEKEKPPKPTKSTSNKWYEWQYDKNLNAWVDTKVEPKPIHEFTKQEYIDWDWESTPIKRNKNEVNKESANMHEKMVRKAVKRGEKVSPEVLKDYPELQKPTDSPKKETWEMTRDEYDNQVEAANKYLDEDDKYYFQRKNKNVRLIYDWNKDIIPNEREHYFRGIKTENIKDVTSLSYVSIEDELPQPVLDEFYEDYENLNDDSVDEDEYIKDRTKQWIDDSGLPYKYDEKSNKLVADGVNAIDSLGATRNLDAASDANYIVEFLGEKKGSNLFDDGDIVKPKEIIRIYKIDDNKDYPDLQPKKELKKAEKPKEVKAEKVETAKELKPKSGVRYTEGTPVNKPQTEKEWYEFYKGALATDKLAQGTQSTQVPRLNEKTRKQYEKKVAEYEAGQKPKRQTIEFTDKDQKTRIGEYVRTIRSGKKKGHVVVKYQGVNKTIEPGKVKKGLPEKVETKKTLEKKTEPKSKKTLKKPVENIQDFGEKIGGARKDISERGFTKGEKTKSDGKEPWRKKYVTMAKIDGTGWTIAKAGDKWGISSRRDQVFATEEEAEKAIPLYAVAEKHSVYQNRDDSYSIYKRVSDRKRLKVVAQNFESREKAMEYMAKHAEELLNLKTSFGEEILPLPEKAIRKGKPRRTEDATPEMFMKTFAPRGIEFGNWNNQAERQQVMNYAYDGLLDLADALNISPKALMLNGELSIAFGARGQGLSGAKAHYEPKYGVINLTKMKGAGSLAHEWMHAFDHYLARLDTKAESERVKDSKGNLVYPIKRLDRIFQSHGKSYKSKVRPELQEAYTTLVESMYRKAEKYVEDTKRADTFLVKARQALQTQLDSIRNDLAKDYTKSYTWRKNKRGLKPASAEQLAEFDKLAKTLVEGGNLQTEFMEIEDIKRRSKWGGGRFTNDTLESINKIYKAVRNRSGFRSGQSQGVLDLLRAYMNTYAERIRLLEDAKKGTEKEKKIATNYAIEAKKMDQARTGDYWSSPPEMVARAFASYVEDKIAENGGQSDFLVYHAHGGIFLPMIDGFVARPYPEGKERIALNNLFDDFIGMLKESETDKGVMLASLVVASVDKQGTDKKHAEIVGRIQTIQKRAPNAIKTVVLPSVNDLPDWIKSRLEKKYSRDTLKKVGGLHVPANGGMTFIFTKNQPSVEHGVITWFHEQVGHHGIQALYGDAFNDVIQFVKNQVGMKEVRRVISKRGYTEENTPDNKAVGEYLAFIAEKVSYKQQLTDVEQSVWDAFIKWLKGVLELRSTSQAEEIVLRSYRYVFGLDSQTTTVGPKTDIEISASLVGETGSPQNIKSERDEFKLEDETKWQAFRRLVEDINHRIKIVQEQIEEQGGVITEESDVFLSRTLLPKIIGAKVDTIKTDIEMPFLADLVNDGLTLKQLDLYMHAKHAPERNRRMKENGYKGDTGSGMSDKQANMILGKIKSAGLTGKLEKYRVRISKMLKDNLDYMVENDLMTEEEAKLLQTYEFYIPLHRDIEFSGIGTGRGVDVKGKEIKRAKGSERKVLPITAQVFNRLERTVIRSEKNKVAQTLARFIRANPAPHLWSIEKLQYTPRFDKNGELQYLDPKYKLADNVFGVKFEGKQYLITIKDKKFANALRETGKVNGIGFLRAPVSFLSVVSTKYSPEFLPRNFQRDLFEGLINMGSTKDTHLEGDAGKGFRRDVIKDTPGIIKDMYRHLRGKNTKWSAVIEQFQQAGGQVGHFWLEKENDVMTNLEKLEKQIRNEGFDKVKNKVRFAGDVIGDMNTAVELGVRIATFHHAVKRGVSEKRAAEIAADLTLDFNKAGELGPLMKSLYLFINPQVQGTSKAFRGIYRSKKVRMAAGAMVLGGFANGMLSILAGGDDDDDIPQYTKNTSVVFALPNGHQVSLFKLPYGFNSFWSIGRSLAELGMGRKTWDEVMIQSSLAGLDSFNPLGGSKWSFANLYPSMVKPFVEIGLNESWSGSKIMPDQPMYGANIPDSQRYWDSVSDLSIFITKHLYSVAAVGGDRPNEFTRFLDISPETLDYAVAQYSGGVGKFIMNTGETVGSIVRGDNPKLEHIPFVRDVYKPINQKMSWQSIVYSSVEYSKTHTIDGIKRERFYTALRNLTNNGYMDRKESKRLRQEFDVNQGIKRKKRLRKRRTTR